MRAIRIHQSATKCCLPRFAARFKLIHFLLQYLPDSPGTTPTPYFVPTNATGLPIFGVFDPSIEYIGQLSDVWMNVDKRFDTSAQVVGPLEALRQLLGACELNSRCKVRHKVLLAQMPYYKASQSAAKLKAFDLVIAQPDAEHATGDENTSCSGAGDAFYLLTPGVAFRAGRSEPLTVNLRRADYFAER